MRKFLKVLKCRLEDDEWEIFKLKSKGLNSAAIARIMNISEANVNTKVSRARKKIAKLSPQFWSHVDK